MAIMMTGEVALPADRAKIWAMPNDAEVLEARIPGRQSLDKTSPLAAAFKGAIELCEVAPASPAPTQS